VWRCARYLLSKAEEPSGYHSAREPVKPPA
jgi:hypothetical protein